MACGALLQARKRMFSKTKLIGTRLQGAKLRETRHSLCSALHPKP